MGRAADVGAVATRIRTKMQDARCVAVAGRTGSTSDAMVVVSLQAQLSGESERRLFRFT
jgi:hypothetical protein